jgi:hypothetical protein
MQMNLRFLLSLLLPYKRTTEDKARQALIRCGVSPEAIEWRVGEDGAFAFGKKHPDAENLTEEQISCVLDWTRRERIKVGFIGWERDAR